MKESTGRPRHSLVDNIRMDLQEVGMWTELGWPRIVTAGGDELSVSTKYFEFLD